MVQCALREASLRTAARPPTSTPKHTNTQTINNKTNKGETRDTTELAGGLAFLFDAYLSRSARAQLARTWGSLFAMLPVGGPKVWGNATWAPDDAPLAPALRAAGRSLGGVLARVVAAADGGAAEGAVAAAAAKGGNGGDVSAIGALSADILAFLRGTITGGGNGSGSGSGDDANSSATNSSATNGSSGGKDAAGADKPAADDDGAAAEARGGTAARFLDVDGALRALAATGGRRFAANLARWAPAAASPAAAARIGLPRILAALERAEADAAARRRRDEDDERAAFEAAQGSAAAGECRAADGSCAARAAAAAGAAGAGAPGEDASDAVAAARARGGGGKAQAPSSAAPKRPPVPIVDFTETPLPKAPNLSIYCL